MDQNLMFMTLLALTMNRGQGGDSALPVEAVLGASNQVPPPARLALTLKTVQDLKEDRTRVEQGVHEDIHALCDAGKVRLHPDDAARYPTLYRLAADCFTDDNALALHDDRPATPHS